MLTDTEGHVVMGTVPKSNSTTGASTGVQFPSPGAGSCDPVAPPLSIYRAREGVSIGLTFHGG